MSTASLASTGKKRKVSHLVDFSDTTIVVLTVGPEKKPYNIYRELLCQHSRYFRNMFKGEFKEASEKSTNLPDTSCETIEDVMRWMHSGVLNVDTLRRARHEDEDNGTETEEGTSRNRDEKGEGKDDKDDDGDAGESDAGEGASDDEGKDDTSSNGGIEDELDVLYAAYLDIYIFADQYDVPDLRLTTLKTWQRLDVESPSREKPLGSLVKRAFASLPANSPLCKYLIRSCAYRWSTQWIHEQARFDLPYIFMIGVMAANSRSIGQTSKALLTSWCWFHEHGTKVIPDECIAEKEELMKTLNDATGKKAEATKAEPVRPQQNTTANAAIVQKRRRV
ncbi:uncharacterized protein BDZ99DRAFT_91315 [Mytilinidion resinicola]|uniref:BTB domain-containing protein n=1 Tax=Mytilinidion resinicola TaxID=574789 RepID=A0A6A6YC61_9PEZI|nr:uncharacterized protein BDZ99DRAFT_91315 [Mytilinidion resinicola]KAF2806168.1 hypothetical protein BDZ99DRAFT_91315 [Mytilinidion resinicola]